MNRPRNDGPTRVLGYVRVSSEDQSQNGVSLDAQRHRLKAYAEAHGLVLVRIEADEGLSARTMSRPGLQRALASLGRREGSGLIILKLDRLSRSTKDVISLVERSGREGWALHSLSENLDTGSAMGRFVVALLGSLAQLEREVVGERTRIAMTELRRQGRRTSRTPPFGYCHERGRLVPVLSEMKILARIISLTAQGLGCVRITRALNGEGPNPRVNRPWNVGTVRAMLRTIARRQAEADSCAN